MGKAALLFLLTTACQAGASLTWNPGSYTVDVQQGVITIIPFTFTSQGFGGASPLVLTDYTINISSEHPFNSPFPDSTFIHLSGFDNGFVAGQEAGTHHGAIAFDFRLDPGLTGWVEADLQLQFSALSGFQATDKYLTGFQAFRVNIDPPAEVPEPSTFVLLGFLLAGTALLTRRHQA